MIGQMPIAMALRGFNDLRRSVNPTFLSRNILFTIISTLLEMNKKSMKEVKTFFSRFLSMGHRILPSCGCKACETMVAKCELGGKGTSTDD